MFFKKWLEVFDKLPQSQEFNWIDGDTDEPIPGPDCKRHCSALFNTGIHHYRMNFELIDDDVINIDFVTKKNGVFLTREGIPFIVMNHVTGALGQYLAKCPIRAFTFTQQSEQRGRVFERILTKVFPDFHYQDGMFVRQQLIGPPTGHQEHTSHRH